MLNRLRAFFTSSSGRIGALWLLALSAVMIFNWAQTVQLMVHNYTPLPSFDYWRVVSNVNAYRFLDLRVFWRQHNEHRILFPEIVFAVDMLLLHGRKLLPLIVSFFCHFGAWIVIALTMQFDTQWRPLFCTTAILLSGIIIGWKGSALTISEAFNLEWTLVAFVSILALYLIWRLKETSRISYFVGTVLCGIIASYSSLNGLLLWAVLILAGLVIGIRRRHLVGIVIAAIITGGVFLIGYHFSTQFKPSVLMGHPAYFVGFVSSYLSMPFGAIKTRSFGVSIGLANILIFTSLIFVTYRARLLSSPIAIVTFGFFSFMLLTAIFVAAGRMDPSDKNFFAAKAARFANLPLINWSVLVAAALWISEKRKWKVVRSSVIAVSATVPLGFMLLILRPWVHSVNDEFAEVQWGALSVANGLADPALIQKFFPDPAFVEGLLPELHTQRLSIFYKNEYEPRLGRPVREFSRILNRPQLGAVAYTFPVRSGVEVVGWAENGSESSAERIVFVNESGRIVGFGEKLPAGFPYLLQSLAVPSSSAWIGFVNLNVESKAFSSYLVTRKGLVRIGREKQIPAIRVALGDDVGPLIGGLTWQMDPTWTASGIPSQPRFGAAPPQPFYGSWSADDKNTGRITSSSFAALGNACLILPVLHGYSVAGLSVKIVDADTNAVLSHVPMQNGEMQWRLLRVPITPAARQLRIIAEDQGRDWGQWLAVGQPDGCAQ